MQIKLEGWHEGFSVVEACKLIVANSSLNLMEAKRMCEALLDGNSQVIVVDSEDQGHELANSLRELQVVVQVHDGPN